MDTDFLLDSLADPKWFRLHEVTAILRIDGYLVVGGWDPVMYIGDSPTGHDASVYVVDETDGSFHTSFTFHGEDTDVWAFARRSDGAVVAGGSFMQLDDPQDQGYYPGVCLLSGSSFAPDTSFTPLAAGPADIRSVELAQDGTILAAGSFSWVNGVRRDGLARLHPDGTLDQTFAVTALSGDTYTVMTPLGDGTVLVGRHVYRSCACGRNRSVAADDRPGPPGRDTRRRGPAGREDPRGHGPLARHQAASTGISPSTPHLSRERGYPTPTNRTANSTGRTT